MHEESSLFLYDVTCQYAAVDVATAKVIAAEVRVCYLGMLCKCKTAVLVWFNVFLVQYDIYISVFTPPRNRGGVIFSLQFVCVCVCVCLSVCVSRFLVNKIPTKRMNRFGRGFR